MNYSEYKDGLAQLLVLTDPFGKAAFEALLPRMTADAEGRIFGDLDLDFLWQRTTDFSQLTTPGIRSVPIPPQFLIIEKVNLITPANTAPSDAGSERIPLLRTTRAFLDTCYPNESAMQPPARWETYFALYTEQESGNTDQDLSEPGGLPSSILIGPSPDNQYHVEISGTYDPPPISAENPNTYLATFFPELLLAAAMVFGCAILKNWSAMADDPRSAISWENHYQDLKQSASAVSKRQKSQGPSSTPSGPALSRPTMQSIQAQGGGG